MMKNVFRVDAAETCRRPREVRLIGTEILGRKTNLFRKEHRIPGAVAQLHSGRRD